ncbi:MAG TPA: acetylornithine deacetylase, partial [Steroidobacteraceae bacterium]
LALIEYVRDFLASCGVGSKLYGDESGRKANLYAVVGPRDRGGVLLSGHTDVVPVDGQRWTSDPFRLVERGGRLYARGAADMKGFIACALRAAQLATERELRIPLQLAFSYDEEVGCVGVRSLIDDMATWAHRPQFCIVGEPTLLRPAIGHKGKTALAATCRGHAAHSASPGRGINAIYMATELVDRIRARQSGIEAGGVRDDAYEVPYTTLHVGVVHGGTVLNIVPSRCDLEFEIRDLPEDDVAQIVAGMREDAAAIAAAARRDDVDVGIDVKVMNAYPPLDTPADSEVVALVAALTGQHERIKVGFGSEGGLFSERLGVPTVVCGPGSIDQAHKPDEFIDRDQLHRCDAMMDALLDRLV